MKQSVLLLSVFTTLLVAFFSLLGWFSQYNILERLDYNFIPMAPLTAICLLLIGACILFHVYKPEQKLVVFACGLFILFFLVDLLLSWVGISFIQIEKKLIKVPDLIGVVPTGRMSPITSFLFLMSVISVMAITSRRYVFEKLAGVLNSIAFTVTLVLLIGYLYNSPLLYGQEIIPVALSTSICFFLITVALFDILSRDVFPLNLFFGGSTHARLLRVFLPLTAFLILAGGAMQLYLRANYPINEALVLSIMALASVLIVALVTLLKAQVISNQIEKAEAEKKRMVSIIEATSDMIGIFDKLGAPTYLNSRLRNTANIDKDSNISQLHISDFFADDQYSSVFLSALATAEKTGEWIGEIQVKTAHGKPIPVSLLTYYQSSKNGYDDWYTIVARDISIQKEAQQVIEEFAYTVSHDLKEPLRMIRSFSKLLEKKYGDKLDEMAREYISFMDNASRKMGTLIDDLLQYSRVGRLHSEKQEIDTRQIIDEVIQLFEPEIKEKNAIINYHSLPVIRANPVLVKMLFQNLVGNALKYQKPGNTPQIIIRSEDLVDYWEFLISDNGIGIEKKYFEDIFMKFRRLHSEGEYRGSGMGLAICKKIVEQHQGTISVESEPGAGSVFHLH